MRAAIYAANVDQIEVVALAHGIMAYGASVECRSMQSWRPGSVENFDAVVIRGQRGCGKSILRACHAADVPVMVQELGFIDRAGGQRAPGEGRWQLSVGDLNKAPQFDVPGDRLSQLGIECREPRLDGKIVMVLGQVVGDASHGLSLEDMNRWAKETCSKYGAHYRPHPRDKLTAHYGPQLHGDLASLWPFLSRVETLCSTAGLEALIEGVPAVAHVPDRAVWGELSGPVHPGREAVENLVKRIAYSQWTLEEFQSGEAFAFAFDNKEAWNA